jgi:hypothetical protein
VRRAGSVSAIERGAHLKALSGETLSLIADYLRQSNSGELDAAACGRKIAALLTEGDPFVERKAGRAALPASTRDASIGADALARLNVLLPWTSYHSLSGEGRFLGTAWSPTKRANAQPFPDKVVLQLNQRVPLRELSVLEVGCYEGHHTASLAQLARSVWAFDARIENVIKTLVRLWMLGLERSAVVQLIDIEGDPVREQLARLGRNERFDLIHHRGVLYHLSKPIEHLADLASLCDRHLYIHTQIARDEQANTTYQSVLGDFRVFSYGEAERSHAPFAGMIDRAAWLTRGGLLEVLGRLGFGVIQVLGELDERNGRRIELIASRR